MVVHWGQAREQREREREREKAERDRKEGKGRVNCGRCESVAPPLIF
jgi:hypothetical protein